MSKEPGQMAYEAWHASSPGGWDKWYASSPGGWDRWDKLDQPRWSRVESAIRADERAKVIDECAKAVDRDLGERTVKCAHMRNTSHPMFAPSAPRGPNMDELIALAEALEKKAFKGPTMEAVHLRTIEWKAATALRASQTEIARLRKALLAAYAALDNGAEREDVKDDIHAALETHNQTS